MKLSRLAVYVSDTNHLNIVTVLVQYTLLYNTPARCCLGNYMARLSLRLSRTTPLTGGDCLALSPAHLVMASITLPCVTVHGCSNWRSIHALETCREVFENWSTAVYEDVLSYLIKFMTCLAF